MSCTQVGALGMLLYQTTTELLKWLSSNLLCKYRANQASQPDKQVNSNMYNACNNSRTAVEIDMELLETKGLLFKVHWSAMGSTAVPDGVQSFAFLSNIDTGKPPLDTLCCNLLSGV